MVDEKRRKGPTESREGSEKTPSVVFSVYWQKYVIPGEWTDMLVYLYNTSRGEKESYEDLFKQVKNQDKFDFNIAGPVDIKGGTEILIKPEIPGFRFAPGEIIVKWYEDWVPVAFRMESELKGPFPKLGRKVNGKVRFFVGPLLINEININVIIKEHLSGDEKFTRNKKAQPAYRKIFASYAHEDLEIVKKIETTCSAFGNKYIRDLMTLRSGEAWEPAILDLIKEADVFHLFWSSASKVSEYVKMEWREALKQGKDIRVVYCEKPMPEPPPELAKIQFQYIGDINDGIGEMVEKISPVTFSAHWQHYMMPKEWTDLMVYLYSGEHGEEKTYEHLKKKIKYLDKFDFNTAGPAYLKVGTEIKIKPEMPGFRFAPKEMTVEWYKDWVPVVFQMMTEIKGPFPPLGKKFNGQVKFFVGPLLINEIEINVIIKELLSGGETFTINKKTHPAYRKIFPSYSHKDSKIVNKIESTYSAFGDEYMRDVKKLRCGQEWQPEIIELIKEADVFHLFWSYASEKSPYVEKEWKEALKQARKNFIRPVYWEEPMPKPPNQLKGIQFTELDF